jgi:hypothetical protein
MERQGYYTSDREGILGGDMARRAPEQYELDLMYGRDIPEDELNVIEKNLKERFEIQRKQHDAITREMDKVSELLRLVKIQHNNHRYGRNYPLWMNEETG